MEKLELKHLCGYLPWGLKMMLEKSGRIETLKGLEILEDCLFYNSKYRSGVWNFKPLLIPLSALTEPLEDGNVPIVELAKIAFPLDKWALDCNMAESSRGKTFDYSLASNGFCVDGTLSNSVPNQLQLFEYLYSIHADIHDLIIDGLAIDKRTVK